MPLTNGTTILAADLNGVWTTALATLRSRNSDTTTSKQFTETFHFNGVIGSGGSATPEYLRTIVYVPRTDVVLRAARLYCMSTSATAVVATLTIPSQIVEDNAIVGGNIKNTLTATATRDTSITDMSLSGGIITLPNTELFTFLAGDNIDLVVNTNSANSANIIVSLLLETSLVP
jgi:hypothetical protein